jgi:hypothetical protein
VHIVPTESEGTMRRIVILLILLGGGFLLARKLKVHERLMARCEAMFERMPDTFPPKRMMGGIEDIRAKTARILELLETRTGEANTPLPDAPSTEAVRHTA